jgi:TRAP-type transport system periplasmic protein
VGLYFEAFSKRLASVQSCPAAPSHYRLVNYRGVVDGQENPLQNIYDFKLFETQKHLALTGHIYNSAYVVISERFFQRLSEAHKKAVLEAMDEAGRWQFDYMSQRDGELLEALKKAGMQVTTPNADAFRAATAAAYDAFYARFGNLRQSIRRGHSQAVT